MLRRPKMHLSTPVRSSLNFDGVNSLTPGPAVTIIYESVAPNKVIHKTTLSEAPQIIELIDFING